MVELDRWFRFFGRGKGSLRRAIVAAAAVVLALAALGLLIWSLVTSASRLTWLSAIATVLAVVLAAWAMSAQMLAWVARHRTAADRVRQQLRSLAGLDPFDLGVHRPVKAGTAGQLPDLPRYVPREHDAQLRQVAGEAVGGASRLAVVVGGSSTGKTRTCWQMLASLPGREQRARSRGGMLASLRGRAPQWLLWQPISPTRPEAVLDGLGQVVPHTVVWLDEAQLYLDTPDDSGERVAAGLRELLGNPERRPVLVVATLWPEYWNTLTTRAHPDRHAQARELLTGHNIYVPENFSPAALKKLEEEAGADPRLAEAAAQAGDGQITQYLAGVPVLLEHYEQAPLAARALIWAAMDARRLGCGPHLPLALLKGAAPGYLTDAQWDQLDDHWLDQALAYATQLCKGIPGPLTRVRPRNPGPLHAGGSAGTGHDGTLYQLADYLDQHGRRDRRALIPPPNFWTAIPYAQPADLTTLAASARARGLYRDAARLLKDVAARGDPRAGANLIDILCHLHPGDHRAAQWVTVNPDLNLGDPYGISRLLRELRAAGAQEQVTALLARDPAAHVALGDPYGIDGLLDGLREAGAQEQVTALADRAAALAPLDNPYGIAGLLRGLREAGAQEQVTALADRAAALAPLDNPYDITRLLHELREAGAQEQVTALLARDPAAHVALDSPWGTAGLLHELREAGAQEQVTALLARDPAAHVALDNPSGASLDNPSGVAALLRELREAGAQEQVAALADRAAALTLDNPWSAAGLLRELREAGAQEQTTALLARDPAAHVALGDPYGIVGLLDGLREAGAQEQVTALADRAAALSPLGDPSGVAGLLAGLRLAGAQEQATALLARDPAAHVALDSPSGVAALLAGLRLAGAQEQVTVLLARDPAAHVALDKPAWLLTSGVNMLLGILQQAGAQDQVTRLVNRLPDEGLFDLFCTQGNHQALYRFGRNPDGSAAEPWGWEDLE